MNLSSYPYPKEKTMHPHPTLPQRPTPQITVRCGLRAGGDGNQSLCQAQVVQAQQRLNQLINKARSKGCL